MLAETPPAGLREFTLEALGEGRAAADALRLRLGLVLAGSGLQPALDQARLWDLDDIFVLDSPALDPFISGRWAGALVPLFQQYRPRLTLCAATPDGQELSACLAARLGLELVSACTWVKTGPDNGLRFIRPVLDGRAQETLSAPPGLTVQAASCMATLIPGAVGVAAPPVSRQPRVIHVPVDEATLDARVRRTAFQPGDPATLDLREADKIVSGGRGAVQAGAWSLLADLADALGASVGGSRLALDLGAIPSERMVGQTGKTVSPRLYIAAGISGLLHHLGGVHARHLVAINHDRSAPVFRQASLGVVADLSEVLPLLVERIRAEKAKEA